MKNDNAIEVRDLHKSFRLPHERITGIKQGFVNLFHLNRGFEQQKVLDGISFEIKKGEFFGIIGRNGSGKSTLLKILAGIYTTDSGAVQINGLLTPFIELGVGFNPELTGRENVFLNGALLGFSRKEITKMYDEIVEFAELERFMDQKLKNYSSGMQVRLAFSIAIQAKSDILLLDEVLAVGDYNFQQKCFDYFRELKKRGVTVVLVTHDMESARRFCSSGIHISHGKIVASGQMGRVVSSYTEENIVKSEDQTPSPTRQKAVTGSGQAKILGVATYNEAKRANVFRLGDKLSLEFSYQALTSIDSPTFGAVIADGTGRIVFATNTLDQEITTPNLRAGAKIKVRFNLTNLFDDGKYTVSGAIANKDRTTLIARIQDGCDFRVVGVQKTAKAPYYPPHSIEFINH